MSFDRKYAERAFKGIAVKFLILLSINIIVACASSPAATGPSLTGVAPPVSLPTQVQPSAQSTTVPTSPVQIPPAVTTDISPPDSTRVTLSGTLTSLGSAGSVLVCFQYGLSADYENSTPFQILSAAGTFTATLAGLTGGTPYHFRAVAIGDGMSYGADQTFTVTAGWLSGWSNRIQITIDHDLVNATLTDFPVLIHLSSSSGRNSANVSAVFTALGDNSQKIAVTAGDGNTQCYVEINSWDSSSQQATLYARVPRISATSDTILYLYYDNSQADNTSWVGYTGSTAAKNVWDSNFVAVYHLAQQGSGTVGEYTDSTSHSYNGQGMKTGTASLPSRTTGVVRGAYAQLFNGTANYPDGNFIKIPDQDGFSQPTTGYLMMSFWINPTTLSFSTYDVRDGYVRFLTKAAQDNAEWQCRIYNDTARLPAVPGDISAYAYNPTGGLGAGASITRRGAIPANKWSYITVLFIPTSVTVWLNAPPHTQWGYYSGYTKRTVTYDSMGITMQNGTAPVAIGAGSAIDDSGFFSGKMSEIRFSNTARSEAWIIASFYSDRDELLSYSSPRSSSPKDTVSASGR